jgi:hypothetical protein
MEATMLPEKISGDDPIERIEPWSRGRKYFAFAIRLVGFLLGVGLAAVYLLLMWSAPPDLAHARPSSIFGLYLGLPLALFAGSFWLADWLAGFVDHQRLTK